MRISSSVTDIWLFYCFADLAVKCLFRPILGGFWGFAPPKCSQILSRPRKGTFLAGNTHFWRIDRADRSRNATWVRAVESKKRRKKEKKLRDVTSHIFAQTTHVALPHQSGNVVGSRT